MNRTIVTGCFVTKSASLRGETRVIDDDSARAFLRRNRFFIPRRGLHGRIIVRGRALDYFRTFLRHPLRLRLRVHVRDLRLLLYRRHERRARITLCGAVRQTRARTPCGQCLSSPRARRARSGRRGESRVSTPVQHHLRAPTRRTHAPAPRRAASRRARERRTGHKNTNGHKNPRKHTPKSTEIGPTYGSLM